MQTKRKLLLLGTLTLNSGTAEVFDMLLTLLRVNYQLTAFQNYFRYFKYAE